MIVLEAESPLKEPVVRLEISVVSPTRERKRLPFLLGLSLRELVVSTISKLTKSISVEFEVELAVEVLRGTGGIDSLVDEAVADGSDGVSLAGVAAGVSLGISAGVLGTTGSGVFCAGLAPTGVSRGTS